MLDCRNKILVTLRDGYYCIISSQTNSNILTFEDADESNWDKKEEISPDVALWQ
jgi:hypothetical protein